MVFQDAAQRWHAAFSGIDATAPFRERLGLIELTLRPDGKFKSLVPEP
jgi:hypothetical protein